MARTASSRLTGRRRRISSRTGSLVQNDTPRSPCSTLPDVGDVLPVEGLIQAQHLLELGLVAGVALLAHHQGHDVARKQPDDGEDQQGDEGQRRHQQHQPAEHVAGHDRERPRCGASRQRPSGLLAVEPDLLVALVVGVDRAPCSSSPRAARRSGRSGCRGTRWARRPAASAGSDGPSPRASSDPGSWPARRSGGGSPCSPTGSTWRWRRSTGGWPPPAPLR